MTSAARRPAGRAGSVRADGRGYGLVLFAATLLSVIGCFNLIYGIAAIANSHVFVANAHFVFANLKTWGWITLILAVLQILVGIGVLAGNQVARWFGVVLVGLNAIDQMFFIPAYPFWSLTIIAVDVVALYGLVSRSSSVSRGGEAEAGENDHKIDGPQRRRRPVPAGEITQRATLLGEGGHALPSPPRTPLNCPLSLARRNFS